MHEPKNENHLHLEQSPYLLQHAENPVAWYPWSDEAFEIAEESDKPVFVSIGYATCHWCHVMAHESFEDREVADFLNEHFISVKVDREERPDVDAMCMDVCQSLTGHGGWPLTIVMDAQRRPFFAGTYFPRTTQGNRLGFLDLMRRLSEVWAQDRDRVIESATEITKILSEQASTDFRADVPENVMEIVAEHHKRMFDDQHGGFSSNPKFPSPHHLLLLMRIAKAQTDNGLLSMVFATLDAMRAGGIYDQVGFGFHRYSTDRKWLVPHFEKMLYDQAMMIMAYTEAWQISQDPLYRTVVLEIADYLQREMCSPDGAFYTAQDADSEGEEGKFYVWSANELSHVPDTLLSLLNVSVDGNFHDEATGNPVTTNILHVDTGNLRDLVANPEWEQYRTELYALRSRRIKPLTDDKVLTDWNGLAIGALARAGRALGEPHLVDMALRAFNSFTQPVAFHRFRNGQSAVTAMLDDHAMFGWASLELYQSTGSHPFLAIAMAEAERIKARFLGEHNTLYQVSTNEGDVPVRQKNGYDSAYPCGNSMASLLYAGLGQITNMEWCKTAARDCVMSYASQLERFAPGFCMLLCAWDTIANDSSQVFLNGRADDPFIIEARSILSARYSPRTSIVYSPQSPSQEALLSKALYPFATAPSPSVLICTDYACQIPVTELELL